jgi:transcriptional regulator with XRE-family HTH domain
MIDSNLRRTAMVSRLRDIMWHTTRYSIDGRARLITDTGVSRTEIRRLLSGDCNPSFRVVTAVAAALEKDLGVRIDGRDILSFSGDFPSTVCVLVRCRGCPECRPLALNP